jgi:dihydroflavonol-4-reductase
MQITDMINGKIPMYPDMAMSMVDVRDVATLHVKALTAKGAPGRRFIAASAEPIEMATIIKTLKSLGYKKVPSTKAPSFLLRIVAWFDREARGMVPFLGQKASFDISDTVNILEWTNPTKIEVSLKDMATSIASSK